MERSRIPSAVRQKLRVRALLDHASSIEHDDLIGTGDRRESVRHRDHRSTCRQSCHRGIDRCLGLRIEGRCGLIEDQNRRIAHDRSRDGHALLLASRQPVSALADIGVIAIGQIVNEVVNLGGAPRPFNRPSIRVRISKPDVLPNRRVEEKAFLKDRSDLTAPRRLLHSAQIQSIDEHRTSGRIVEAHQEAEKSALAASARTDDGHSLSSRDGDGYVVELRPRDCVIAEAHVIESDRAAQRWGRDRFRVVDHRRPHTQDFLDALHSARRVLKREDDVGELLHRRYHPPQQLEKREESADGKLPAQREDRSDADRCDHQQRAACVDRHTLQAGEPADADRRAREVGQFRAKATGQDRVQSKRAHNGLRRDIFLRRGHDVGHLILTLACGSVIAQSKDFLRDVDERNERECDESEAPLHADQHDGADENGHAVDQRGAKLDA